MQASRSLTPWVLLESSADGPLRRGPGLGPLPVSLRRALTGSLALGLAGLPSPSVAPAVWSLRGELLSSGAAFSSDPSLCARNVYPFTHSATSSLALVCIFHFWWRFSFESRSRLTLGRPPSPGPRALGRDVWGPQGPRPSVCLPPVLWFLPYFKEARLPCGVSHSHSNDRECLSPFRPLLSVSGRVGPFENLNFLLLFTRTFLELSSSYISRKQTNKNYFAWGFACVFPSCS